MRRLMALLLLGALAVAVFAGPAAAGSRPWVPDLHSPPSPAEIQADWGTPAQEVAPDQPWIGGYPYDKVPDHPLPAEVAGGPR